MKSTYFTLILALIMLACSPKEQETTTSQNSSTRAPRSYQGVHLDTQPRASGPVFRGDRDCTRCATRIAILLESPPKSQSQRARQTRGVPTDQVIAQRSEGARRKGGARIAYLGQCGIGNDGGSRVGRVGQNHELIGGRYAGGI